ncbi:toxin regulator [Niallia sp.]|uniref:toxin regulator n=1 Tax=Niallia sp. TaxID=2837523 RepID=UPI00289BD69C|nr:toxin regulator [Niallia sp.]
MEVLGGILFFIGFIGFIVYLVRGLISLVKKNGTAKNRFKYSLVSFVIAIIGSFIIGSSGDTTEKAETANSKVTEETPEEKAAREAEEKKKEEEAAKKAAEEKAKAEAEAKAKAEQEAKEKAEAEAKAKKEAEEKRANAKPIEYDQLKKNPDRHAGEYVKYEGQIVQIMEGDNLTQIRLAVTKDSYGWDINDLIFVEYDGYTDFVEDDVVTIYGEVYGAYSYTSQAGWEITLPAVMAEKIE